MEAKSNRVRIGVVGVGGMGGGHAGSIMAGNIARATLGAVCDANPVHFEKFPGVPNFTDFETMLSSGTIDAVLIATPHYFHTTQGIAALKRGIPVLTEKPIAVHKADAERMIEAWQEHKPVFAAMFNVRTSPVYQKVRQLLQDGTFGSVQRVTWIVTDWFRSEAYYGSGSWRATWGGEGGGILVNQCPHNLDIFQWLFGMPERVTAVCRIGKYHNIEVEDEFHAIMQLPGGGTGCIIASTGESPGTNRLEIAADNGRILVDGDSIQFTRNVVPLSEWTKTTKTTMSGPERWEIKIPVQGQGGAHNGIILNFVNAILDGEELIAPAQEGIHSVELANAILYSSFQGKAVDLPLESATYEGFLKELIAGSRFKF